MHWDPLFIGTHSICCTLERTVCNAHGCKMILLFTKEISVALSLF